MSVHPVLAMRWLACLAACLCFFGRFSSAADLAPQDGLHLLSSFSVDGEGATITKGVAVLQTVGGRDLLYYVFYDAASATRGIRARDLEGNLVYQILLPADVVTYRMAVATDGTVYAAQRHTQVGYVYRVYLYTLSGGTYSLLRSVGPNGPGEGDFGSKWASWGTLAVSPVTGKLYVDDQRDQQGDLQVSGNLRVYDASGTHLSTINTNGALASTLEGGVDSITVVPGHDGSGELWVRGTYSWTPSWGGFYARRSRWVKVFAEDGSFKRVFDIGNENPVLIQGDLMFRNNALIPLTATDFSESVGKIEDLTTISFIGRTADGRFVSTNNTTQQCQIWEAEVFRTFEPRKRNANPNPFVSKVEQRSGSTVLDIDFRVEDSDDATVTVAALALADGTQNVLNVVPMTAFVDGTGSNLGAGITTNTRHHLAWNAATDWNVDFGDVSVMILARDSRTKFFDVHLVAIPADGARPAVTISRNPLKEYDFTMQWLWLIARADPSITLTNGIVFGVGGDHDGMQLTDSAGKSTSDGRAFLLARDGLRVATAEEVTRAREGATPGHVVQNTPPRSLLKDEMNLPLKINEYGIETSTGNQRTDYGYYLDYSPTSNARWHVVLVTP